MGKWGPRDEDGSIHQQIELKKSQSCDYFHESFLYLSQLTSVSVRAGLNRKTVLEDFPLTHPHHNMTRLADIRSGFLNSDLIVILSDTPT